MGLKNSNNNNRNGIITCLIALTIAISMIAVLVHFVFSQQDNSNQKRIASLVNSYIGFLNATTDNNMKESDFENLKYRYFSENAINLGSKTVYRSKDILVEDSQPVGSRIVSGSQILKKTQFMEVFQKDKEIGDSRINFVKKEGEVVLSTTFGRMDCSVFSKKMIENNLKVAINDKSVTKTNDVIGLCANNYNIVVIKS